MDKEREATDAHLSTEYTRFEDAVRSILSVPKAKVDEKMKGMKKKRERAGKTVEKRSKPSK